MNRWIVLMALVSLLQFEFVTMIEAGTTLLKSDEATDVTRARPLSGRVASPSGIPAGIYFTVTLKENTYVLKSVSPIMTRAEMNRTRMIGQYLDSGQELSSAKTGRQKETLLIDLY
jgi:hypothetical protein